MLDAAYPPRLAQSWDSVGLVCGDPADAGRVGDASPSTPPRPWSTTCPTAVCCSPTTRCCCAAWTRVAADTPKGALVHRLIRTGRALFTAHTNADSAAPGVSDALADALGLTVVDVLDPVAPVPTWTSGSSYVPPGTRRRGAGRRLRRGRRPDRRLLLLQLERDRHRTVPAARRRARRRSARVGHRGAGGRGPGRGDRAGAAARPRCWRRCAAPTPTRSPRSTSSRWRRCPPESGWAGSPSCRAGAAARLRRAGRRPAAGDVVGCARGGRPGPGGVAGRGVRRRGRFAARHGRARRRAGVRPTSPPTCATIPPTSTAAASDVALVDVAHWASEYPWCAQAAALLRAHFGDALPVRVIDDPHRPLESIESSTMKADVWQQHSLLELAELDAELTRIAHRAANLAEQQRYEQVEADHRTAGDRVAVLAIAIEDLDGQVQRLESEIDGVRQREDRDRALLDSPATELQAARRAAARAGDAAAPAVVAGGLAARGHGASRTAAAGAVRRCRRRVDGLAATTWTAARAGA